MGLNSAAVAGVLSIGDVTEAPNGTFNLTTNRGTAGSVFNAAVEDFLGIDNLGGVEGSAIKGSLYMSKGQTFSFDWTFSMSNMLSLDYDDFAFVNLKLDTTQEYHGRFAKASIADAKGVSNYSGHFDWVAAKSGVLNYGIGIMDLGNKKDDSAFVISNINPVPLPAAAWLFLTGLLGLVGFKQRTAT